MTPIVILTIFGGLIYGSFLNVLLWRLPEGKGIGGRSYCRTCHHQLSWYDLIPILSFIVLRGRCRYCHSSIHIRYPIVEASTAVVLALFFIFNQPTFGLESIITVFVLLVLVSLLFFDLFYLILPDVILLPTIVIFAIYDVTKTQNPLSYFLTALLSASFFAILYTVSKGKNMGFGDVKLALLIGLILGYPLGLLSVIGGIWLAAFVAIILLGTRRVGLKDKIPLGFFLALSTIISIVFHNEILPITFFFR